MAEFDTVIRSGVVVTAADVFEADLGITDGVVTALGRGLGPARREVDAAGRYVTPGGIDTHCHFDQPMRDSVTLADDFLTGTVSAAHGGTTTVVPFACQLQGQSPPSPAKHAEPRARARDPQYSENVYDAGFNPARSWPTPGAIRSAPALFVGAPTPERGTFFGYTIPTMAALYAAEFFTEWNPLKPVGRWTAFGFDVALGLVLGYVFAFTWEAFARAEERLQETRLFPVARSLARKAGRYLLARALLLGNLALLAGVLAGCVLLSGRMLETRNWLNPLPIVVGTSIDGLLHSRTRPDPIEPQTWRTFLTRRSDIVPQLAIIAWAIWHLVS